MNLSEPAVVVDNVTVEFATASSTVTVFKNVSFAVAPAGFITIIGPSGCGKSTLLRAIADLVGVNDGVISVFGRSPEMARRARDFGFVFQEATLLPWLSAIENIRIPLEIGEADIGADNYEPSELLELVGLSGREQALPHQLSGGMQQRVSIARALVCKPRVLLMDEPFGALDEITRDRLNNELLNIWRKTGTTIIFVTHSISEAAYLGQKTLVFKGAQCRSVEYIDIELPGERRPELLDTMEFVKVVGHLRGLLSNKRQ